MPTALTTIDQMERLLSKHGVESFADHDADGQSDDGVTDDSINYAIGLVRGALVQRYNVDYLGNAPVLREYTTVIASRTLCLRRGNPVPESLEHYYLEITDPGGILERIAGGKPQLVDDSGAVIPGKSSFHPTHSNLKVDRRYPQEQIRVQQGSSLPTNSRLERDYSREYPTYNG